MPAGERGDLKRPETNGQMQRSRGRTEGIWGETGRAEGLCDVSRDNKQGSLAWAESLEERAPFLFAQKHQCFQAREEPADILSMAWVTGDSVPFTSLLELVSRSCLPAQHQLSLLSLLGNMRFLSLLTLLLLFSSKHPPERMSRDSRASPHFSAAGLDHP